MNIRLLMACVYFAVPAFVQKVGRFDPLYKKNNGLCTEQGSNQRFSKATGPSLSSSGQPLVVVVNKGDIKLN